MDNLITFIAPTHPGEILLEDYLKPLGMSAYALAKACDVPRTRIERIVREETPITADTALRLSKVFGSNPQFWMKLQSRYDLEVVQHSLAHSLDKIQKIDILKHTNSIESALNGFETL